MDKLVLLEGGLVRRFDVSCNLIAMKLEWMSIECGVCCVYQSLGFE